MAQVQRERLLEDHHVDALAELRAQQRLAGRESALGGGQARDEHALQRDVSQYQGQVVGRPGAVRRQCGNDRVDDLCADVGDGRRQHAGHERQQRQRERQPLARGPDEFERVPRVAEDIAQPLEARKACGPGRSGVGIESAAGHHDRGTLPHPRNWGQTPVKKNLTGV